MTQEALKLALEKIERFITKQGYFDDFADEITAIKEALAQPKKEPIAYINVEKRTLEFAKQIFWHTPTVANLDRIPLYTQRTWVGLTDTEIDAIYTGVRAVHREIDSDVFARAIEAKLKEKNNG